MNPFQMLWAVLAVSKLYAQPASVSQVYSGVGASKPGDNIPAKDQPVARGLTVGYLDEFFTSKDEEKPTAEVQTRMQTLIGGLLQMPIADVDKLLREFAGKERLDKLAKDKGWDAATLESRYNSFRQRAKETRQIYGAVRFTGLDATAFGWDKAYAQARQKLENAPVYKLNEKGEKVVDETTKAPVVLSYGVDWKGVPLPTEEQREMRSKAKTERKIAQMVKDVAQDRANRGLAVDYAAIADEVKTSFLGDSARRMAASMVLAHGPDLAELVAMTLPEMINISRAGNSDLLEQIADGDEPEATAAASTPAGTVQQAAQDKQAA